MDILGESYNPNIYQVMAKMVANTELRTMADIMSDLRAVPGITIVNIEDAGEHPNNKEPRHVVTLSIKIDPAPFKPFSAKTFEVIAKAIRKIPAVLSLQYISKPTIV